MNITIVGAGNVGTQFAVHCAEKKHEVIIYSSKPEKISKHLSIVDEQGIILHSGEILFATNNASEAFENADIIFVTMPAFGMQEIASKILPYAREGMKIALIPGTGGGECAFKECGERGATIMGLQRVPSVARLVEYGRTVCASGYRETLHVATLPSADSDTCCEMMSNIFDIPCVTLPNYLNLTLTPSNPILHTTRLRCLFKDYAEGVVYNSVPLFYEGWNDETSELLFKCDAEVQEICRKLSMFDLSYVKSLKVHYESETVEALTKKIKSIQGFKGLKSPVKMLGDKYIPDLHSRYFTADFPFGLSILVQIADFVGVEASIMKETLAWYKRIAIETVEFSFEEYHIKTLADFIKFYQK